MKALRLIACSAFFLLLCAGPTLAAEAVAPSTRPAAERIWYAQGWTHPIVVHMPIALLLAGAIAAVLRVVFRRIGIGIVYYCLLLGALGSVPSTLAGWAWAPQKDSAYVDPFDLESGIFWHRWGGVAVTVGSLAVLIWATSRLRRKSKYESRYAVVNRAGEKVAEVTQVTEVKKMGDPSKIEPAREDPPGQFGWQFCVVLLAAAVGWIAHDGGELVYPRNFERIMNLANGKEEVKLKGEKKSKTVTTSAPPAKTPPDVTTAPVKTPDVTTAPAVPEPVIPIPVIPETPTTVPSVAPSTTQSIIPALPVVPGVDPAVPAVPPTMPETVPATSAIVPSVTPPTTTTSPAASVPAPVMAAGDKIDFAKQIWPIWEEKCIYCHGADKQKGKLRMDTEEASKKGGSDDGPLYILGRGAESPLIVRAHSEDEDIVMPPPKEKKALTPEEIKLMTQWIDEGAVWNR